MILRGSKVSLGTPLLIFPFCSLLSFQLRKAKGGVFSARQIGIASRVHEPFYRLLPFCNNPAKKKNPTQHSHPDPTKTPSSASPPSAVYGVIIFRDKIN